MTLVIDQACGEIPAGWKDKLLPMLAARGGKPGVVTMHAPGRTLYLHRLDSGALWLTVDPGAPAARKDDSWGPPLWKELHAAPFAVPAAEWPAWLAAFTLRVPCGECRQHWKAWTKANPPDLSTAEAFWEWTVAAHSAVSERIGKPVLTPEEARALRLTPA